MTATITTLDAVLKQLYRDKNFADLTYTNRPLLALLTKMEKFKGRNMPLVHKFRNTVGRSATFSTAQTNAGAVKYEDFLLTRRKDYGVAVIDGEGADASEGDEGSFIDGLEGEIDATIAAVSDSMEQALLRSGTGSIGVVSSGSTVSAVTITLSDINTVVCFEIGQVIAASATDGSALRTGTEIIAGVNRSTGVLTATSAAWNTVITALATGDFLYVSGDRNLKFHGLEAWIPATAPTAGDSFFGVDRSVDSRLMGQRVDASTDGRTIEEALIDGQGQCAREGGRPDVALLNNVEFRKLVKSQGSRVQYPRGERYSQGQRGAEAAIGFKSIVIQGDYGDMDVIPVPACPAGVAWVLTMSTWGLHTTRRAPSILMRDGLRIQRSATADSYEVRVGVYGNLGCTAVGENCRVTLPS